MQCYEWNWRNIRTSANKASIEDRKYFKRNNTWIVLWDLQLLSRNVVRVRITSATNLLAAVGISTLPYLQKSSLLSCVGFRQASVINSQCDNFRLKDLMAMMCPILPIFLSISFIHTHKSAKFLCKEPWTFARTGCSALAWRSQRPLSWMWPVWLQKWVLQ